MEDWSEFKMSNRQNNRVQVLSETDIDRRSSEITSPEYNKTSQITKKKMFHGEPPPEYSISSVIIDRDQRIPEKSRLSVIKKKEKNNAFRVFWIFLGLFIALVVLTLLGLGIYGIVTILNTTTTRHTASSTQTTTLTTTTTTTTVTLPSQCSSYTTINDITRLGIATGGSACDSASPFSSSVAWIRFSGIGGHMIVNASVGTNRCGTDRTGWYTGTLPTRGDTVVANVCFTSASSNCVSSQPIAVTNCDTFYVYGLVSPPSCNARYCTV